MHLFRLLDGTIINLDNVARVAKGEDDHFNAAIFFTFVDGDYLAIYPSDRQTYEQVSAWMEGIPTLA